MYKNLCIALGLTLSLGCQADSTGNFRSAITGEVCQPNLESMGEDEDGPKKDKLYCKVKSNNGHGNNEDGVDSSNPGQGNGGPNGETDSSCDGSGECIDDENRTSEGAEEECELPPGCDADLCCDGDGDGDDGDGDDGDGDDGDGDDGDGDDGDGDDGDGDDGDGDGDDGDGDGDGDDGGDGGDGGDGDGEYTEDPSCQQSCTSALDCAIERSCTAGCCTIAID